MTSPLSTLSLIALHGMNIPMYGAIKRCTPLVNLVLSVMVLRKPFPSVLLTFSIGLITVGVLIAGLGDLTFDGHAYTMGTLSVFAQVAYIRPTMICNILFLSFDKSLLRIFILCNFGLWFLGQQSKSK